MMNRNLPLITSLWRLSKFSSKSMYKHQHVKNSSISPIHVQHHNLKLFHTSPRVLHGEYEYQDPKSEEEVVMVTILTKDDKTIQIRGKIGDNILYLAKRFEIDIEGACEASLACTTCHVYVDDEFLDTFPPPTETEDDLLDNAPFLKDNSRLGCQLILTKEHDGLILKLPLATRNFYVDGHKPSHH